MVDTSSVSTTRGSSSGLDNTHPEYDCRVYQWQRCRDSLEGQDAIKRRNGGMCYLPPTAGMVLDGMDYPHGLGYQNYQGYLARSHYYGYVSESVDLALGMLWNKPPVVEGLKGTPLEYLETKATHEGESLERLLYRINEAQISTGRIGILADMPAPIRDEEGNIVSQPTVKPEPYISIYNESSITNWDASFTGQLATEALNLVVLNESGPRRTGTFEWEDWVQYRVLSLGPIDTNEELGVYRQGVFSQSAETPAFDEKAMFVPNIQGRELTEIPFVFINANSTTSCPQDPPLLSLVDLCLHLYRLQADYSAELHGQTSATLITKGLTKTPKDEKKPQRLGVGGHVDLGSNKDSDAWFLELSGKGLPELRIAVNDVKQLARERSGEIVDQSSRGRESGSSLEQRISVRTATLHSIAQHGAEGVSKLLKVMARWVGMTDDQISRIKIVPNTVFAKTSFDSIDLLALAKSKLSGGAIIPFSMIHQYLVQKGLTTLSFDEAVKIWKAEKPLTDEMNEMMAEAAEGLAKAQAAGNPTPGPVAGSPGAVASGEAQESKTTQADSAGV
jgi:hypothetical protein